MYLFVGRGLTVDGFDRAVEFGVDLTSCEVLAVNLFKFADLGAKNGNDVVIRASFVDVADDYGFVYEGIVAKEGFKLLGEDIFAR